MNKRSIFGIAICVMLIIATRFLGPFHLPSILAGMAIQFIIFTIIGGLWLKAAVKKLTK
ncbi:MAG: hypothetical protein J0H76_05055 [Sphingobacteriales bacterium]|nr:hypothetical protein [Sphingobacteriales bacterium]